MAWFLMVSSALAPGRRSCSVSRRPYLLPNPKAAAAIPSSGDSRLDGIARDPRPLNRNSLECGDHEFLTALSRYRTQLSSGLERSGVAQPLASGVEVVLEAVLAVEPEHDVAMWRIPVAVVVDELVGAVENLGGRRDILARQADPAVRVRSTAVAVERIAKLRKAAVPDAAPLQAKPVVRSVDHAPMFVTPEPGVDSLEHAVPQRLHDLRSLPVELRERLMVGEEDHLTRAGLLDQPGH